MPHRSRFITVPRHDPGDYLHPEQSLELVDEQTGHVYELYVRSSAAAPAGGEMSLFIPVAAIQSVQTDAKYCVVTLSRAATPAEERKRQQNLPGTLNTSSGEDLPARSTVSRRTPRRSPAGTLKRKR